MRRLLFVGFACSLVGAAEVDTRARQIAADLNALRADPSGYARHIEARIPRYRGKVLRLPGQIALRTAEGAAAAREAVRTLRTAKPVGFLQLSNGLSRAAADHVADIGPKGLMSHDGSAGEDMQGRIARYGARFDYLGETISFGPSEARAVVIDLLVDDGVPGRGHRKILLDPRFRFVGAACGSHAVYRTMCVLDFARQWEEKKD